MGSNLALVRNLLFLVAVGLFLQVNGFMTSARAVSILCEEVCTESTPCSETCYENMMEHENGNAIDCLEYGVWDEDTVCCGDGICDADPEDNENGNCEADCGEIIIDCPTGPTCNPYSQTGCDTDEACAGNGCCVPEEGMDEPEPPPACFVVFCFTDGNCCPGEQCIQRGNWGQGGVCYIRL